MRLTNHILGLAIIATLSVLPGFAQAKPHPSMQTQEKDGAKFSQFNVPVEIPDVPIFTGKQKLVSGFAKETEEGTAYIQSFSTPEPPEYVVPWYDSVLTSNHWKIVRKSPGFLSARKGDGSYCSVSAQRSLPENAKESRCSFEVSYFKFNPNHKSK